MPLVQEPTWDASITFVDNDGNKARMGLKFRSTLAYAEAAATVQSIATAAAAVTNAAILSFSLATGFRDDTIDTSAISEASDVEGKLVFQFRADNGQLVKTELPSPKGELVVAGTNVADPANAAVAAFIDAVINGAGGINNGPVTNTSSDLSSVVLPVRKIHRASSKG